MDLRISLIKQMRKTVLCVAAILFLVSTVFPNSTLQPLRTETPPVIDGSLDDKIWESAPSVTGFKTFHPDFGIDMSEKTIVYMAYDRENLYFGFKCFDSQPNKIKASIARRDTIRPDDWVCINLDSFNDQQSLYALYINPLGIQTDSRYASGQEDFSQDFVFYSAGRIDEEGYVVEVQLPLKSFRFSNKKTVEMGVIFERRISRISTHGTYPALSPEKGMFFLTQMQPMVMHDIRHYTLFELLPAVTLNQRQYAEEGDLKITDRFSDISLTAKYGITSKLILDATYNPDFSQVESDAGQVDVNLRYDLYFPEKRPFFLEGKENFNFGGFAAHDPLSEVVYTRKIVDPLAGIKLSGKIGTKNTLASLFSLDESPSYTGDVDTTGKYAMFSILRYKRALSEDSYLGGFFTSRNLKNHFNLLVGPDGQIRLTPSSILGFHLFYSQTGDDAEFDNFSGHALGLDYLYATRKLDINLAVKEISKDFNTETGYLTRTGLTMIAGALNPKFYPNMNFLQRIDASIHTSQLKDHFNKIWETYNALSFAFILLRSTHLSLSADYSTESYMEEKFNTSGLSVIGISQFTKQFNLRLAYRYGKKIYYSGDPYQGKGANASGQLIFEPSEKINLRVNLIYSDFFRDSDSLKIYDYTIARTRLTYQMNKYLTFRGIVEYNDYNKTLLTDFLVSFLYIPGTVIHLGYGSLYEKIQWVKGEYRESDRFLEMERGLFFKVSYLWRL
ncbi:MAG: DUF5916 domain-containing protein [Candidatus Aminicenantes bacterium]|jgi:hypothetical protein